MINLVLNSEPTSTDIIPLIAGSHKCPSGHSYGPYVRDHYIIHFCLSGCGVLKNKDGEHRISAGELFIIRPSEVTTYTADRKNPWHYAWISFVGMRAEIFRGGDAVRSVPKDIAERILTLCEAGERSPDIYASILYEVIYRLYTKAAEPSDKLSEIKKYIDCEYMNSVTAANVAHLFGFERSYLYRMFKKRYGFGIKEYIIKIRMKHAHALLEGGHSVSATAYMVGYHDEFNFSKGFKRHFGYPPKEARGRG